MIERLADTFVAGIELLEAEGRVVRDRASRLALHAGLLLALGVIALLGLVTLGVGLTWLVALQIGAPEALSIIGALVAAGAGWGAYEVYRRMRS